MSCGYGLNAHLNGARNMSWRTFCYRQKAAGRAEPVRDPFGVKGWGRGARRLETAERHSGPDSGGEEKVRVSVLKSPLDLHPQASCKPRTSVRGR